MENPSQIIKKIINRISEIIWWNRGLTKLDNIELFQNYETFIMEKLIDIKGPYLEFILPPKAYNLNTRDFLNNLDFDERVIKAVIQVLFKGNNLHLYEHQAQTIRKIIEEKKDIILSVPTATGKTEAFLIPILDYCIKCNKKGLKALIIYPMKTLEVDQLNRFVKYLYELNNSLEDRNSIKIGIWDGDTPNNVGNPDFAHNAIPSDSYYRGMVCPICKSKLRINNSGYLYCESHGSFTWVMVTRDNISNTNVDILISNPESIDFLLISPSDNRKCVIGNYASQYPLKYIVFDEIHIWTGLSGAGIKLFIERLRSFFKQTEPQLILLSATVKEPEKLIKSFTTIENFETIEFQPFNVDESFKPDFNRLKPCLFEDLIYTICYLEKNKFQIEGLKSLVPNCKNALKTLRMLNLITIDEEEQIKIKNNDFFSYFKIDTESLLKDPQEFENFLSDLLENYTFREKWRGIIINNMPEVINLINFSSLTTENPVKFITLVEIANYIQSQGVDPIISEDLISMCLNFGRIADLLTDRYHLFLKPRNDLFWCQKCLKLLDKQICECGNPTEILLFCRTCHEVFLKQSEDSSLEENNLRTYPYSANLKKCPNCKKNLRLYDLGVPYTTFISFLISAACRKIASQKILIFSDGRGSAERIGGYILSNDYSLVAEQVFLKLLIDSNGTKSTKDIFIEMIHILNEYYYVIFKDESLDTISEDIIEEYRRQSIRPLANISNMYYSIENALVSANCIYQLEDNIDYILAHELLKIFTSQYRSLRFTKNKITFTFNRKAGITIERIGNRFKNKFNMDKIFILKRLYPIIKLFIENNVISEFKSDEIEDFIQSQRNKRHIEINDIKILEVKEYLETERRKLQQYLDNNNFEYKCKSGVFSRDYTQDDFEISLVKKVVFCQNCYTSYPIINEDLDSCPICKSKNLFFGSRIDEHQSDEELKFSGLGYLNINTNWNFNIDHWASDTLAHSIESEGKKIQRISLAVHRAGLPYSLRGIFEEGFRKHPPSINAISATPTLELGIDIGSLDMISLVGIPPLLTNYVQRAGRTGRTIGKPSYVFNIIRNSHAIDNYYFNDLNLYFKEFKPIFIPDPKEFDIIYASHIIIVVCSYLARNPDPRNVYERLFRLPESYLNIKSYYKQVIKRFKFFITLVRTEKKGELERLIRNNYGEHAITIFHQLFFNDDNDLFLLRIVDKFFGKLQHFEADQSAIKSLTDFYRSLDWWLSALGLIANYRGSSSLNVPIYIPKAKSGEKQFELKELDRAIRENYPGPKNTDGSLFRVETSRYIVYEVHGTSENLVNEPIKLCINALCRGGFIPYLGNSENCQMCGSKIEEFKIYGLNTIKVRPARRLGDHFETTPLTVTYPELLNIKHETLFKFFNLNANIQYGNVKVVKSTVAFHKKYTTSREPILQFSEAFIESTEDEKEELFDPLSLDENLEDLLDLDEIKAKYHPVGLEYQSLGIKITFKTEELNKIVEDYYKEQIKNSLDKSQEIMNFLFVALYSIQHAFKKMVSIYTESNMNDFEICFNLSEKEIQFYLIDNCEGGNGISKRVLHSLLDDFQIYSILEKGILNCTNCQFYCDNCLLIERTREFIVKNNLLDRNLLNILYSGKSISTPEPQSMKEELEIFWKNIIAEGETKFVEFKSTLRWDVKQNKLNKDLQDVIAKEVCAFLNTEGGKLFIGIEDNRNIFGLEKDYSTLGKKNSDGFLLTLDQVLNNRLGKQFNQFLIIKIIEMNIKAVCIIEISKSGEPVFFKKGDQDEFYIRGSAGKQPLGIKETLDYIKLHWPERR